MPQEEKSSFSMENSSKVRPVVLIVDDNRMNLDLMVAVLKDEYQIKVALNGEHALDIVKDSPPDIILLDVMMPGMDGYEVCKRLKSDSKTDKIPIIFITARSLVEDETVGFACGAVDYITKPISPPVILARLKTHLALYDQKCTLEKLVSEKTAQLRKSMEKAERASKAKSAFMANISHEIRTPLNQVQGLASMLRDKDDDPQRLELIDSTFGVAL